VTTICKTILSGSTPEQIRDQIDGLAPAQLGELAASLAEDPDLTISVLAYDDGRLELEVLHSGPPHRTEHTIDRRRFARQPQATPPRNLSITTSADVQDAVAVVRGILLDSPAPLPAPARAGSRSAAATVGADSGETQPERTRLDANSPR
jgi:hypothetical protein